MLTKAGIFLSFAVLLIFQTDGQTFGGRSPLTQHSLQRSSGFRSHSLVWEKDFKGLISDFAMSSNGARLVIHVVPDPDRRDSIKKPWIRVLDRNGKSVWKKQLSTRVKDLAISADGNQIVATLYDQKVHFWDAKGRERWKFHSICRPYFLSPAKKVICVYDDDTHPRTAFDLYSFAGKKVRSEKITRDLLGFAVSEDQTRVAVSLDGGRVLAFNDLVQNWGTFDWPGEVVSVATTGGSGTAPTLAGVIQKDGKKKLVIQSIIKKGPPVIRDLGDSANAVHFLNSDSRIAVYGNGRTGQNMDVYDLIGNLIWNIGLKNSAEYQTPIVADTGSVSLSLDVPLKGIALYEFDSEGKITSEIPFVPGVGAFFLGTYEDLVFLACDDGRIRTYQKGNLKTSVQ